MRKAVYDLSVINILQVCFFFFFQEADFLDWELKGKCKLENTFYICLTDMKTLCTALQTTRMTTFILETRDKTGYSQLFD